MEQITPKAPSADLLARLVHPSLASARGYKIDTPLVTIKLDQNESPWDLPLAIKEKVVTRLLAAKWNRYPSTFSDDLADEVAASIGLSKGSVLLAPGSNYLVSLLLSIFTRQTLLNKSGKVVIARPSFPLYESHCQYEGIPYEIWPLNSALDYDLSLLPSLPEGSVVIFASPNNPVGNTLSKRDFITLLTKHPQSLFIADEAYFEYAKEPYTELLAEFSNLLLVRTFSKTMGCAGVRVGYVAGHSNYINLIKKLRLPYLLNHFSIAVIETLLKDNDVKSHLTKIQANAIGERERVRERLTAVSNGQCFTVKPSEANFLLLRFSTQELATAKYQDLIKHSILVRDVSASPGLTGCLRVTLGDVDENNALLKAFGA